MFVPGFGLRLSLRQQRLWIDQLFSFHLGISLGSSNWRDISKDFPDVSQPHFVVLFLQNTTIGSTFRQIDQLAVRTFSLYHFVQERQAIDDRRRRRRAKEDTK